MTKKFNSEPDAQECDATDVEQCVVAGYKMSYLPSRCLIAI